MSRPGSGAAFASLLYVDPRDEDQPRPNLDHEDEHYQAVRRFPFISDRELRALKPAPDLVDGLLVEGTVNQLFAPKNHFKTFLAIDLAYAIATGRETFLGRRIRRQGAVAMLCAEGAGRLNVRVQAWCEANGITGYVDKVAIYPQPANLLDGSDLRAMITTLTREHPDLALVVVDTLSQNAPGIDENSAKDMSRLLSACQQLQRELSTTVLVIHHPGKADERNERGSSAFSGGCANVFYVQEQDGVNYLKMKYVRDGRDIGGLPFTTEVRQVWRYRDADGNPLTTCVIRPLTCDGAAEAVAREQQNLEQRILSTLRGAARAGLSGTAVARAVEARRATVTDLLRQMQSRGLVASHGAGSTTKWTLVEAAGPPGADE